MLAATTGLAALSLVVTGCTSSPVPAAKAAGGAAPAPGSVSVSAAGSQGLDAQLPRGVKVSLPAADAAPGTKLTLTDTQATPQATATCRTGLQTSAFM